MNSGTSSGTADAARAVLVVKQKVILGVLSVASWVLILSGSYLFLTERKLIAICPFVLTLILGVKIQAGLKTYRQLKQELAKSSGDTGETE